MRTETISADEADIDLPDTLPEGWVSTTVGQIAQVVGGGTPDAKDESNFCANGGHAWLTPADLSGFTGIFIGRGRRNLTPKGLAGSSARLLPHGAVLMSSRAPIGYLAIAAGEIATNQGFKSFICSEAVIPSYLFFWLRYMTPVIHQMGSGSTFLEVSGSKAKEIPIRVPPLSEQRRIVQKVEALLARVGTARERLRSAPRWIDAFRDSVLAQAYRGDFRNVSEIDVEGHAEYASLGDLATDFSYGTSAKSSASGTTPVLRMGNIQNGKLDWQDLVYTSDPKEIKTYELQPGDVLFNRTNSPELVGKTALYQGERPSIYAGYLIRIRCSARLLPAYLNYCLNSPQGHAFCDSVKTDGVSQSNINATKLRAFPIASISIERQNRIVRAVDALLKQADAVEGRIRSALSRIVVLTQSLLAKAFAGELVPTAAELAQRENRDYEPASELLERIRQEPAIKGGVKKPRARRL
ncbi:MAG TPA: restriction endonuclease subunit S [Thermoanaerobaculia bacterium]|nr:restriction endonuclease subunit S [Thermoanaerobaculia bacterium]